jgi:hypothetical protein
MMDGSLVASVGFGEVWMNVGKVYVLLYIKLLGFVIWRY